MKQPQAQPMKEANEVVPQTKTSVSEQPQSLNSKNQDEKNDHITSWARWAAHRMRSLPPEVSMAAMIKCDQVISEAFSTADATPANFS